MGNHEVRIIIYISGFVGLLQGIQRFLVPIALLHYGWNLSQYGAVYVFTALAMTIPMIFGGYLSDIKGRKVIIFLGFAVFALGSFLFMITITGSNLVLIIISQIIATISFGVIQIGLSTILADETKGGFDRTNALGLQATLKNLAMFLGPFLMGLYLDFLSAITLFSVEKIQSGFLIITVLAMAGTIISLILPITPEAMLIERKQAVLSDILADQKKMYTSFTFQEALIGFTSGLIVPFIDFYILDHFNPSSFTWGLVFGLSNSTIAIGSFMVGRYSESYGKANTVMFLNIFAPVFALFIAISPQFWQVSIFYILRSGFANAVQPAWESWFYHHTPSTFRGRSLSVIQINRRFARAGGTALGPILFTTMGTWLFPIGCLFYPFAMAIPRRTEQGIIRKSKETAIVGD